MARCLLTACRVMASRAQRSFSVCPFSARRRSSNSRRLASASALNTASMTHYATFWLPVKQIVCSCPWNPAAEARVVPPMSAQASVARKNQRKAPRSDDRGRGITKDEIEDVEELATPRTPVIYEVVRRLGEEEMARPMTSLWWSGVAAGLSISFSLLSQAILTTHLPQASWQPQVVNFGYCIGFIMAVLSHQQLFTESTITAVIPVAADVTWSNILRMARLWATVLAANLAGTLLWALFCVF